MTFILRWPSALALLALALLCLATAALGASALLDAPIPTPGLGQETLETIGQSTWLDVGLFAGAGLFFFITTIRLARRTQGFWTWLLGFACYGGRWAWVQQSQGDLLSKLKGVDPNIYLRPDSLLADLTSTESQVAILALVFVVGLLVFVIDAADRAYWNRQSA